MATLILDEFTDSDSTNLTAHTIAPTNTPATAWSAHLGSLVVSGNKGAVGTLAAVTWSDPIGFTNAAIYTVDAGVANCDIVESASGGLGSTANKGLTFRYVDNANFWHIYKISTTCYLIEVTSNTGTIRATQAITNDGSLAVSLSGSSILFGSQALEGSHTSSSHSSSTKHGLFGGFYTDSFWNDFQIDGAGGAAGQPAIKRMGGVKFGVGPFQQAQGMKGW